MLFENREQLKQHLVERYLNSLYKGFILYAGMEKPAPIIYRFIDNDTIECWNMAGHSFFSHYKSLVSSDGTSLIN